MKNDKEFLYVGHYIDVDGNYILKIGTTKNLENRRLQHNRNYRNATYCRMMRDTEFEYDWYIPLSKYNTLRFEDRTRQAWQDLDIGMFIANDRFCCYEKPSEIEITIRKTYKIAL